jgi:methyltransferase-like protein
MAQGTTAEQVSTYEEVPYASHPFYYTHPANLATLGTLYGMRPPDPTTCSVLELGCSDGGNLIPMAYSLPRSRLVGIDLSPGQIDAGVRVVQSLGIQNVDLRAMSILDIDATFGTFDYIICHGVYSWVPPAVQAKILEICSQNLSPQGLAYVSYNTFPGWHVRRMVREMMCFHVRRFAEPRVQVQQAREFLDFMTSSVQFPDGLYASSLKEESNILRDQPDSYLLHEFLEDVNEPVYFRDFAARASAAGLQWVAEARFGDRLGRGSTDVLEKLLQWTDDAVELEQYLDFTCNRTFRRTVLCHADVRLVRPPSPAVVTTMHVTAHVKPVSPRPDICSDAIEEFRMPDGASVSTNHPLAKAVLVELFAHHPRSMTFDELAQAVGSRLARGAEPGTALSAPSRMELAEFLLTSCARELLELHVRPFGFSSEPSERPVAMPLARRHAASELMAPNLRHHTVELNGFDAFILQQLDGTRDRRDLHAALLEAVARGDLEVTHPDDVAPDEEQLREMLAGALEISLRRLASHGLLEA